MTIFIKTKFNKLDDETNIDKYRVTVNITEYIIISKKCQIVMFKMNILKFSY